MRVILIGMDGLMPEQIERYKNDIPELKELLDSGFFSPAHSSPYTCTATNWPTIATGAWVGTHGCTSFNAHLPGMELGETTPTFNSHLCQAEYFWHAAERQGKRCILVNYPCAFPKLLKDGVVIGGDGLSSPTWGVRWPDLMQTHPEHELRQQDLGPKHIIRIVVQDAAKWNNIPDDAEVLREGVIALSQGAGFTWNAAGMQAAEEEAEVTEGERRYLLIWRRAGQTEVLLAASRDAADPITVLRAGQWSGWVNERFDGRDCMRQYKLLEVSPDGTRISMYGTAASVTKGWGYPQGIEDEVITNAGGYVEGLELEGCVLERNKNFTSLCREIMALQAQWLSDCARHLAATQSWDVMFLQYHAPDGVSHVFLRDLESDDEAVRSNADSIFRETLRLLFRMAKRIVDDCADDKTVVCIVSDHGNLPKDRVVMPDVMLAQRSWLRIERFNERGHPILDTKTSKACTGAQGVWINLKGREKHGCVEPGEEYETLRGEIIDALRGLKDPVTGESAFALVGRREDFQGMGLYGERIEDIVVFSQPRSFTMSDMNLFHTHKDFYDSGEVFVDLAEIINRGLIWDLTAVHWGLPEATVGYASNRPVFLLSGPGVNRGATGTLRVNLVDVAPTLAHVLGIRPPVQSQGRVVWEAFEEYR